MPSNIILFYRLGMKKLIQTLIQSLPEFGNVGAFLVYVFILFATMGLHQYNGSYYNICRYNEKPENSSLWDYDPSI
jgi:Ion transport protein